MEKINVITGHFGSGKSEVVINLAKKLNAEGKKVVIVDIDIVNPFFCIRDLKDELAAEGIMVISADAHLSNAELMVVPAAVSSVFFMEDAYILMDVGGDDSGAVVLGQYNRYFRDKPYDMYFVVNTNRPLTADVDGVREYLKGIEKSSRLKVTKLISNTNLSYETTVEQIVSGYGIVRELSEELELPIAYTAVRKDLVEDTKEKIDGEILPVDIYMKPPWR